MNTREKEAIDSLLSDKEFRQIVEKDIGPVGKVNVDWENRSITFHGKRASKAISIDETLKTLKYVEAPTQ